MKVLVSDLEEIIDINDEQLVSLLNEFRSQGNMFIVATDKPVSYIAENLALSDLEANYYVCNNGAVIFDRYYNVLYRKDLKAEVVRPIVNMLNEDNNILETFIDTSHGYVKNTDMCANGIIAKPYDSVKAEIILNSIVLKFPSVHGHIQNDWLYIIDIDVSKYTALKYLEEHYNLPAKNIYVIGKDAMDLELMENYIGYTLNDSSDDLNKYSQGTINSIKDLINTLLEDDEELEEETMYENI